MKNENAISILFEDKMQYSSILKNFRDKAREHGLTVEEHMLYNLIRGLPLNRGFTPISNKTKLGCNADYDPWHTFKRIKFTLKCAINNLSHIEKCRAAEKITSKEDLVVFLKRFANGMFYHRLATLMPDHEMRALIMATSSGML